MPLHIRLHRGPAVGADLHTDFDVNTWSSPQLWADGLVGIYLSSLKKHNEFSDYVISSHVNEGTVLKGAEVLPKLSLLKMPCQEGKILSFPGFGIILTASCLIRMAGIQSTHLPASKDTGRNWRKREREPTADQSVSEDNFPTLLNPLRINCKDLRPSKLREFSQVWAQCKGCTPKE